MKKAFLYKMKGAVALTLAMTMFSPQVFAAEALSAEEQGVQAAPVVEMTEEEKAASMLPTITEAEALERAIKHSPKLRDLEDTLDYLEETDEKLYDRIGSYKIPNYDRKRWTSGTNHTLASTIYGLESNMKQAKLGEQVTKLALEVTVKSMFSNIVQTQDNLELVKKNAEIQQKLYMCFSLYLLNFSFHSLKQLFL